MEKLLLLCAIMCCGFAAGLAESQVKIPVNEPGFKCVANSQFMDDCNTCTCDESGALARCTAMACDPNERTKRSVNTKCVPGTTWKDDCNQCRCEANGVGSCTRMMCTPVPRNSSFNQYNNTHRYGNNTHRGVRQTKLTPVPTEHIYTQAELDSPTFTCTPSQSFKTRARFCTKFPCTNKNII